VDDLFDEFVLLFDLVTLSARLEEAEDEETLCVEVVGGGWAVDRPRSDRREAMKQIEVTN
jgi:hypothetical protein